MRSSDTATKPALALRGITKAFGDLVALSNVDLDLAPGQVHALLGANGSGKSTLVKVISGVYQPDAGDLVIDGTRPASIGSPAVATQCGIRVVHQEAPLIDTATVAEMVALFRGFGTPLLGPINSARLRRDVQELLDRMDVPVRASALCGTVGPADRAGIALAIVAGDLAGWRDAAPPLRVLIVDEVTAAIHESESSRHLDRLRAIADSGAAVVMVTHRLGELRIADDVTVLRSGRIVHREAGGPRLGVDDLVARMVGSPIELRGRESADPKSARAQSLPGVSRRLHDLWRLTPGAAVSETKTAAREVIAVSELAGGALHRCSFVARASEIVGFAGLRGSGVEDLPRLLSGDLPWAGGRVTVNKSSVGRGGDPNRMIAAGITAIAADRLRAGGVSALTVQENVELPALRRYWHRTGLRRRAANAVISSFDVRPARPAAGFGGLSGGNQQKVLLGKWLLLGPSVLVLADPTYGVDPGARETIFDAVLDAAQRGVCVLFFSTEPEQLIRICTRVLVLRDGAIVSELAGEELTLENVVRRSEQ